MEPEHGELWFLLENELNALTKLEKAKKTKTIETSVPQAFEASLLETLRQALEIRFTATLMTISDHYQILAFELEKMLRAADGLPFVPQHQLLTDWKLHKLLDRNLRIARSYRGRTSKGGIQEFLSGMRRYQMIYLGIAAPLLPVLFLGGAMSKELKWGLAAISIGLLAIGLIATALEMPKIRAEAAEEELNKAKDSLRNELKRILSGLQQEYVQLVTQHLKDELATTLAQLDSTLKEFNQRSTLENAEQKKRIQRQLQNVETQIRQLTSANRAKDTLGRSIRQLQGEIRQLFLGLGRRTHTSAQRATS